MRNLSLSGPLCVRCSTSNCECRKHTVRCPVAISSAEIHDLVSNLSHWNASIAHKHLFLASVDHTEMHPYLRNTENAPLVTTIGPSKGCSANFSQACGQLVIPYVNTNPEYQPHVLKHKPLNGRKYAVSSLIELCEFNDTSIASPFVLTAKCLHVHQDCWQFPGSCSFCASDSQSFRASWTSGDSHRARQAPNVAGGTICATSVPRLGFLSLFAR